MHTPREIYLICESKFLNSHPSGCLQTGPHRTSDSSHTTSSKETGIDQCQGCSNANTKSKDSRNDSVETSKESIRIGQEKVGWLVVLGLTALLDSISVYIEPSPKEREKEERKDRGE